MNAPDLTVDDGAGTQVVPSVSIANLINQRNAVLERLEDIVELIVETGKIAFSAGLGFPMFCTSPSCFSRSVERRINGTYADGRADLLDHMRSEIDAQGWQYLMHESGMRSLMDAKAREEWDRSLTQGNVPELTVENIRSTFGMLHDSRADIFERGVINVFRGLAWSYKTNQPQKFGKRIVVTYIRSAVTGGGNKLGWPNMRHCDELDDLMRVFAILDGKPEPDHRHGIREAVYKCETTEDPPVTNDYLVIKCYRNGNGHVTFRRPDLVDKMNRILAKHYPNALPAPK